MVVVPEIPQNLHTHKVGSGVPLAGSRTRQSKAPTACIYCFQSVRRRAHWSPSSLPFPALGRCSAVYTL